MQNETIAKNSSVLSLECKTLTKSIVNVSSECEKWRLHNGTKSGRGMACAPAGIDLDSSVKWEKFDVCTCFERKVLPT